MSLVPARHNFTIYQGATFYQRIFFYVDGVIQNVEEYFVELTIKNEPDKEILLLLDTGKNGGIALGEEEGTIDIEINANETENLTWTHGIYELFITDLNGRTDVLLRGAFKVILF